MLAQKTITIPKQLFQSLLQIHEQWNQVDNDLEDFLLARDQSFIKKMKKARSEHKKGKLKNFSELKQSFV